MQFQTSSLVTALLVTFGAADPALEPQNRAQTTAALKAVQLYVSNLFTDSAFGSFATALQTDHGLSSSVASFESSLSSLIVNKQTPTAGFENALPTEARNT